MHIQSDASMEYTWTLFSIDIPVPRNGLIKLEVSFETAFTLPSLKSAWMEGLCVGFEGKFTMVCMYYDEKELEYES